MRLVRLLAVALATGCFVVTGELWSSALNPSPTIVFPTPVQPPPRLFPGDLSGQGPAGIVRLKPVPTYPLPPARAHPRTVHRRRGHSGTTAHRAVRTGAAGTPSTRSSSAPAIQRPATPPAAPAGKPPTKPAPGPASGPKPPKSPGKPTPPSAPPTPPVSTPPVSTPPVSTPPVQTPPTVGTPPSTPPVSTPPVSTPPVSTPPVSTPPVSTPPGSTPQPPTPTTPVPPPTPTPPPPTGDLPTRPGNGYGDKNHTHTGPPGQAGT